MANMPPADGSNHIRNGLTGDPESFATLVRENQKMIFTVAFRMTGSLTDAEDLTQETLLRAFQHLDSFRGQSKLSTWLCQIAVNLALNWRTREAHRDQVHNTWAENALSDTPGRFPDELSQRVQLALDMLPPKQRAAVILTVYENQSHAEAARVLNCTEATVSWRVFAARQKLKRLLKGISP
jgi:RNA polymerase sigma-70 factor (ECF subfamily)